MPRKQGLFFLISIETLSHTSFLTHCKHVSMHQQALLAGPAFFSQHHVWNMQGGLKKKKVLVVLFIGAVIKKFNWSFYLSCLSCITMGNLGCWKLSEIPGNPQMCAYIPKIFD